MVYTVNSFATQLSIYRMRYLLRTMSDGCSDFSESVISTVTTRVKMLSLLHKGLFPCDLYFKSDGNSAITS